MAHILRKKWRLSCPYCHYHLVVSDLNSIKGIMCWYCNHSISKEKILELAEEFMG